MQIVNHHPFYFLITNKLCANKKKLPATNGFFDAPAKDVNLLTTCADNIYLTNLLEESICHILLWYSLTFSIS